MINPSTVLWLVFLMMSIRSYAQAPSSVADFEESIAHLPAKEQADTLSAMYEEILLHDQKASMEYLDRAIQMCQENGYDKAYAINLAKKGSYYLIERVDLKNAEVYLQQAVQAVKKLDSDSLLSGLYNRLGGLYFMYGQPDEAMIHFEKGEKIALATGSDKELMDFAINISALHIQMGHYRQGVKRFLYCLELNPNKRQLAMIYNNLGVTYSRLENYDSAVYSYRESMNYCEQDTNPERCKVNRLHNIAVAQLHMEENRKALESLTELEHYVKNSGQEQLFTQLLLNKGIAYNRLGVSDSAIIVLNHALESAKKNQLSVSHRKILFQLATSYKNLEQYEMALQYHEKYVDLKDSLFTAENNRNTEELLAKYESEKKEKEIALLKQEGLQQEILLKNRQAAYDQKKIIDSLIVQHRENEILQLKGENEIQTILIDKNEIEKQKQEGQILLLQKEKELKTTEANRQSLIRKGVVIGAILLLIPALVLIFTYKQRIKHEGLLHAKTEEINRQKVLEVIRDYELGTVKANIEGQEKERERISIELHDGIAGNLAGIKLMLSRVAEGTKSDKGLAVIIKKINNTYQEIRAITHQLKSPEMNDAPFSRLISEFLEGVSSGNSFSINFICHPQKDVDQLSDDIKIEVYRIIQELTSNIIKHARPGRVEVQLVMNDNYVNLLMEDDGAGFDTNERSGGIGLSNIRSRVAKLNGSIDIDSSTKRGTIVNIDIPVVEEQIV